MRHGWVDSIPDLDGGRIRVVRREHQRIGGKVDLDRPATAVIHTTETTYVPNYRANTVPHFTIGRFGPGRPVRLVQHVPLGDIGNALRNAAGGVQTNAWVRLQLEQCAYSSLTPWLPASKRQRAITAALMEWAAQELDIPERRPFPDELGDGVWAVEHNSRRQSGRFGTVPGWFNHLEVPENTHWDCGAEKLRVLLREEPQPELVTRYGLVAAWKGDGHREVRELVEPVTLRRLGRMMATDKRLRSRIKNHKARRHNVRITRRAVERDRG